MSTKLCVGVLLCAFLSVGSFPAVAQTGLGHIGPTGAQVAGAAIGAASVIALAVYLVIPKQKTIEGCLQTADGVSRLSDEKDHHVYTILADSATLNSGHRLRLKGKKSKDKSGALQFQVRKLLQDEGACGSQSFLRTPELRSE